MALILCIAFLSACGSITKTFEAVATDLSINLPPKTPTANLSQTPSIIHTPDSQPPASTSAPSQESAKAQPAPLLSDLYPDLEWVFILKAIDEGLVDLSISGNGLEKISIKIVSKLENAIGIGFTPGLTFLTTSADVQPMAAVEFCEIVLEPDSPVELELEVTCANMDLEAPTPEDSFTISEPLDPALSRLAWAISDSEESFRVNQFAVWIVTNDPQIGQFRRISSGPAPGSGPFVEEIERIKYLFEIADIPIEDYAAF